MRICVSACHVCSSALWNQKSIKFPGAGVTDSYESLDVGPLEEQEVPLSHLSSSICISYR